MKADPGEVTRLVRTARGQLDGVLKMIEEDRYCVEIVNQLLAAQKVLQKAQKQILSAHLGHCVREAFETGDGAAKINEILDLLDRL